VSSRPDINLYSFNGPADNGRFVDDLPPVIVPDDTIADTIKCSTSLTNFRAKLGTVSSGYEDALDINNLCQGIDIEAENWVFPAGKAETGFTLKGGSQDLRVAGLVDGDPLVDIGNASDQSNKPTKGVKLALRRVDGKPIRVRVLNGDMPTLEEGSGPYRFVFPWKCPLLQKVTIYTYLLLKRIFGI
jgi:hypothetical protein